MKKGQGDMEEKNKAGLRVYEVTVKAGQDIKQAVTDFVLKGGWAEVWLSGAIGSVTDMVYTAPADDELPLKTILQAAKGAAEVVGFTGEVMTRERMDPMLESLYPDKESQLFVHIHVCCAYGNGSVKGGGLAGGKAFRALRIFMIPLGDLAD